MRVVLAGSSGFIGTAVRASLAADGHDVLRLVRRAPTGPSEAGWDPASGTIDTQALPGADAVVNLSGAGVGDHRWTRAYKDVILRSRIDATATMARALATTVDGPRVLLNASAIGYYGDRGDEVLTEESAGGDGFLSGVCRAWEASTQPAEEAGVRVCHLRTGLVLGPGGLLGRLVPLFRAGLGGRLGSGRQFMSWISLADEVGAIRFVLDHDVTGPVNLTAPASVRNAEFTRALARAVHRPAIFAVPTLGLKVVLGEFSSEALTSLNVRPAKLALAGYTWRHTALPDALAWATVPPSATRRKSDVTG